MHVVLLTYAVELPLPVNELWQKLQHSLQEEQMENIHTGLKKSLLQHTKTRREVFISS